MTRLCVCCNTIKELVEFLRQANRPGGYRNVCKACHRDARKRNDAALSAKERAALARRKYERNIERKLRDIDTYNQRSRIAQAQYRARQRLKTETGATVTPETKTCTACNQTLASTEFYHQKTSSDGLNPQCGPCARVRARDYANRTKVAYNAKRRERRKKYRAQERAAHRIYVQNNREKILNLQRRWQANNRERTRYHALKREAKRRFVGGVSGHHTLEEWHAMLVQHEGRCAHCGTTEKITRDHIVPLSREGTDLIDNIQPLCHRCNSRKNARLESELDYPTNSMKSLAS